jgi:protein involved in ribonucleotide reduction
LKDFASFVNNHHRSIGKIHPLKFEIKFLREKHPDENYLILYSYKGQSLADMGTDCNEYLFQKVKDVLQITLRYFIIS